MDAYEHLLRKSTGIPPGVDTWEHLTTPCPSGGGGGTIDGGDVVIEPGWQLLCIPIQYGYWDVITHQHIHDGFTQATIYNYIVEQIEDTFAVQANTMVEVFNTYYGDENRYFNFIPNMTDPLSEHNFDLVYVSGVNLEYTGFWVNSIHPVSFTLIWGNQV